MIGEARGTVKSKEKQPTFENMVHEHLRPNFTSAWVKPSEWILDSSNSIRIR